MNSRALPRITTTHFARFCSSLLFSFAFIAPTKAHAEPRSVLQSQGAGLFDESVPYFFFGAGGGYENVSGPEYRDAISGPRLLLHGGASLYSGRWVFDGDLGWIYTHLQGTNTPGSPISVRTRSGIAELNPRYRLSDRWSIGPQMEVTFGTDTAQGPTIGDSSSTLSLGLRAVHEFHWPEHPLRIWASATQALNVSDRSLFALGAGIEFGLPVRIGRGDTDLSDQVRLASSAPDRAGRRDVRIMLDPQKIFFRTNSSKLKPEVDEALSVLGQFLDSHAEDWSKVEIDGHADRRGRYRYNLKLSGMRARSVMDSLHFKSHSDRVATRAFSYLRPLDPGSGPQAWARNRRVELVLKDARPSRELQDAMRPLAKLTVPQSN